MKKFSEFSKNRPVKRLYEQDELSSMIKPQTDVQEETPKANLPENIEGNEGEKKEGEIAGTTESTEVSTFFSKLFESREMAHVYHLQVRGDEGSYAKHMALGSYYDGILGFIDDIIEIYQGQYGIVEGYDVIDTKDTKTKDPVDYFEEVAEYIKHARKCISDEDTHLHNIIDEVVALIYKTLYKLKFNK